MHLFQNVRVDDLERLVEFVKLPDTPLPKPYAIKEIKTNALILIDGN